MPSPTDADEPVSLVPLALLAEQMERVHDEGERLLLLTLLPAIEVAWADGVIQDRERARIMELAAERGLTKVPEAMGRLDQWLAQPPCNEETGAAVRELRETCDAAAAEAIRYATEVAKADGGMFGVGAVSGAEQQALNWLQSSLAERSAEGDERRARDAAALASSVDVVMELLADRARCDTQHEDVIPKGERFDQWPRPSLWADGLAPTVLGVPEDEYGDYMHHIVERYVRSLEQGWRSAVEHAVAHPGVAPMSDGDLGALIYGAPFARFLCPELDPIDRERFGEAILEEAAAIGAPHKVDHSHLGACEPLPGVYVAPTVALFALAADQAIPVAIDVAGHVFRPGDGESWARARYYLVQSCAVSVVLGAHPRLHFPMDSVIGVTREVVPNDHPLRLLIEAHAWLHLPLNYGVTYNERSVAHNHQREIYTPFPVRRDDVFHRILAPYYRGVEGNSAFPPYRYPMEAPSFPGPYAAFLSNYYDVVLAFCRRVVATFDEDDAAIAEWGRALHETLPGFPSPEELADREVLARALTGFIHTVAIWHSTDHHTYGQWPVNKVPQRLRVPPPTGEDVAVPLHRWVSRVDLARQELARRLFYQAHTVRGILDVDYGFADTTLRDAATTFRNELRACDRSQPVKYMPVEEIACSLQF